MADDDKPASKREQHAAAERAALSELRRLGFDATYRRGETIVHGDGWTARARSSLDLLRGLAG